MIDKKRHRKAINLISEVEDQIRSKKKLTIIEGDKTSQSHQSRTNDSMLGSIKDGSVLGGSKLLAPKSTKKGKSQNQRGIQLPEIP